MKTIKDIKAIVYPESSSKEKMVLNFRDCGAEGIYEYSNEISLNKIIETLQDDGLKSKEVVILKEFQGRTFQACPCSPGIVCCNYFLINTCFGCLYDCAYCFLNSYINFYGIVQFLHKENFGFTLQGITNKNRIHRIGTGEFTDSLMFDKTTGIGASIIAKAAKMPNIMVEFKTKSDNIDHLLDIEKKGNTVLAWSVNTNRNISDYEYDTANLISRIKAAEKACKGGYFLAFHFDPIIYYDECEGDYENVVDSIFQAVDPDKVVWISLGCFRYSPGFKDIIQERFPEEKMTTEEMFPSPDGKYRYLKEKRLSLYNMMVSRIRNHAKKTFIYLCMESEDVWEQMYGNSILISRNIGKVFSDSMSDNFLL